MLDIRWIRENSKAFVEAMQSRGQGTDAVRSLLDGLLSADDARRAHLTELQQKQERRNAASKEIGNAVRKGDMATAERLKAEVADIKGFIQNGEARERELDAALRDALAVVPNLPLPDVPVGRDEHDNVEVRAVGEKPRINFKPKEHWELGEALGLMDFERAAKLSGARFTVLKGQLARLERALGQFMLDLHTIEHGYTEMQPPLLVRDDTMFGTGQLPKFKDELFSTSIPIETSIAEYANLLANSADAFMQFTDRVNAFIRVREPAEQNFDKEHAEKVITNFIKPFSRDRERRWLVPTAEVPLTNLVREEIVPTGDLPLRMTALTPCFRSEAGSAGRDTRGMLRQHQFNKVELVSITDAESSLDEHERMTACAEEVLKRLGLPFRTVVLCTGDMGFGARKTYDIEVWLPGQNAYREISSCSVCGDFQARRMDARYRPEGEKGTRFVHTLNGSGVAVGRALIAVMENYQEADGSVTIPEVLRPYMGGLQRIEAV